MRIVQAPTSLRNSVAQTLIARRYTYEQIMSVMDSFNADEWLGLTANEVANELQDKILTNAGITTGGTLTNRAKP